MDILPTKPYLRYVQAAQSCLGCIYALSMSHNTSVPAILTAANAIVSCKGPRHPDKKQVIPVMPKAVHNIDSSRRQDCE
ncbi:hypothetical protein [Paraglaciecola psychrophila]|uniref:hypothetical protein n=1 Tax=Paraglaciecola psychrophila TaxID=326544 RepID=UPI0013915724|nr:hypothetical protein [Paraglaciecola psychrophila]